MAYVLDTSACLIPSVFGLNDTFKTTVQVLKELDGLKDNPRTRMRQRQQIYFLMDLFANNRLHIVPDKTEVPADDELLEIVVEDDILLTADVQLFFKQIQLGKLQDLLFEDMPEHIKEPIKTLSVEVPLDGNQIEVRQMLPNNTYVYVTNGCSTRIGVYNNGYVRFITDHKLTGNLVGIQPKCQEQRMLVDQILEPTIPLVIQFGPAGSGKTVLQLAQQFHLVQKGQYQKIIMQQPPVQLGGRDRYGYFPGSLEEKASIYLSGIRDNLEYLFGEEGKTMYNRQRKGEDPIFEIQSFANLRGRSIKGQLVILDEQQNATPLELKTIITRIDKDSKLILLGDVEQIDIRQKGIEDNGLLYVQDRMYFSDAQQVISLTKTYRSFLAEEQIKRL